MFSLVAAIDKNRGIGVNGTLPWKFRGDMNFFKNLTTDPDQNNVLGNYRIAAPVKVPTLARPSELEKAYKTSCEERRGDPECQPDNRRNVVIMGRKTWDSIPESFRPLAGRANYILTRDSGIPDGYASFSSLNAALLAASYLAANIYVIGGGQIYTEAIKHDQCKELFLTRINHDYECDTFFPQFDHAFWLKEQSPEIVEVGTGITYFFERWIRI